MNMYVRVYLRGRKESKRERENDAGKKCVCEGQVVAKCEAGSRSRAAGLLRYLSIVCALEGRFTIRYERMDMECNRKLSINKEWLTD